MENTSTVASGVAAAAEPSDRGRFWARMMGKFAGSDARKSKDTGEHVPAVTRPVSTIDSTHDRPALGATYTLRVKPDRRSRQLPISPGTDRRAS
jgi:hypothetical protein